MFIFLARHAALQMVDQFPFMSTSCSRIRGKDGSLLATQHLVAGIITAASFMLFPSEGMWILFKMLENLDRLQ